MKRKSDDLETMVPPSMLDLIAEKLGKNARAETIFADPVHNNGMAVIPVGKVRMGFGGGAGKNADKDEEGSGAGGGIMVTPVGYIELTDDGAHFKPIRSTPVMMALVAAGGVAGALAAGMLLGRNKGFNVSSLGDRLVHVIPDQLRRRFKFLS